MNVNIESLQQGANRQVIQGSEMGYSASQSTEHAFHLLKEKMTSISQQ